MDQRGRPSAAGFLAVHGGNLYYEVEGAGEALVFIHGWLGNLRMWDCQARALAGSYRVVRCDMRGFGSTTERVEFAYWADVAALLDHLGVDRAHIVGQSFGGAIAVPGVAHMIQLEAPELVSEELRDFIQDHPL